MMKNKLKFIGIMIFAAVMGFCLASCEDDISFANPGGTNPDSTVAVTGVSLNKSSISLSVGGTETLTETIIPSNATNKNVTWSSSNTAVATVSTSGTVTAVAAGTATITVTTVDGSKKANCSVTVSGGTNPGSNNYNIFVLDISQKTDWDYMVVGKDGSSIFFSVNKSNDIPTRLFLKPDKNSDDGFTILFKENGLPEKVVAKNHILYFGNFRDYKFDLAIIYPNNTIQYFYDIETDINFGAYNQGRAISFSKLTKSLGFVSRAIGIGTCLVSPFFQPAIWGCASYVASEVGHIVVDMVFDGFTADVSHTIIDVIGCAGNIGNVLDAITVADSCISALANTANLLSYMDLSLINQKNAQVNDATKKIDSGTLTSTGTVTGVALNLNTLSLTVGGTSTLIASVQPANATNKAVFWNTSNPAVATVNSNGVVTAIAAGSATITVTTVDGGKTAICAVTVNASPNTPSSPSLAEQLASLKTTAVSGGNYTLEVGADESIAPQLLSYNGKSNIKITLKGIGSNRTISLLSKGSMFDISSGVTLVLDNNITLQGTHNNDSLVYVFAGGEFIMNTGSAITSNTDGSDSSSGGGVYINGIFTMFGGKIAKNSATSKYDSGASGSGGGVFVGSTGTFIMKGGEISENTADGNWKGNFGGYGGGVYVYNGTFIMEGGIITGNSAGGSSSGGYGGGVHINGGTFIMEGGTISGNTAIGIGPNSDFGKDAEGGGVHINRGTFTMKGGKISGNIARGRTGNLIGSSVEGGGIYAYNSTFTMTAGEISGNTTNLTLGGISNTLMVSRGGGVCMTGGSTFTMSGGEISGNTASSEHSSGCNGGGVYISGTIKKTGGTIYGYPAGNKNNVVIMNGILQNSERTGSAVIVFPPGNNVFTRETTAGPEVNLDSSISGVSGGWEYPL